MWRRAHRRRELTDLTSIGPGSSTFPGRGGCCDVDEPGLSVALDGGSSISGGAANRQTARRGRPAEEVQGGPRLACRQLVGAQDAGVPVGAVLRRAVLRRVVDVNDAEPLGV